MERICAQGHVLDPDRELCSRCNSPAVEPAILPEDVAENAKLAEAPEAEVLDKPKKRVSKRK